MRAPYFLSIASAGLIACSSASFDVGSGGGDDSGTGGQDSSVTTDSGGGSDVIPTPDSPLLDGVVDGISTDTAPVCDLSDPKNAPDLYVDAAATGPSNGTAACPFHHVAEATDLEWDGSGVRTIHVVAGAYNETGRILVQTNVTLAGAGVAKTSIAGPGASCSSGNCLVELAAGATMHGFTLNAAGTNGVVTGGGAPAPRLFDVKVSGATGGTNAGILTRNDADIGPAVIATGNQRGLDVVGPGTVTVRAPTGATDLNIFENSVQSGIYVEGAAQLVFNGGEVRHNGSNGIYLNNGNPSAPHQITGASVHGNATSGLFVTEEVSAVVHASQFLSNAVGVRFAKGPGNTIDLGTAATLGNNDFGAASSTTNPTNKFTSLCIEITGTDPPSFTVHAEGNAWPRCAPSTSNVGSCDPAFMSTFIADITYIGSTNPVSYAPCSIAAP